MRDDQWMEERGNKYDVTAAPNKKNFKTEKKKKDESWKVPDWE